jgi:hypothetical protein
MEEGGFIMVQPESASGKKGRGTDGVNTVQGISPEEAEEYFKKQQADLEDEHGVKYTTNKEKKAAVN